MNALESLSEGVAHFATGWHTLGAVALGVGLFVPFRLAFRSLEAKGRLIDQHMAVTPHLAWEVLTNYGEQLRRQYLRAEYVDLVVVPVLAGAIGLVVSYSFERAGWSTRFNLVPLAAAVLNTAKVLAFVRFIRAYPRQVPRWVRMAGAINLAKNLAIGASLVLAVASLIALGWQALSG